MLPTFPPVLQRPHGSHLQPTGSAPAALAAAMQAAAAAGGGTPGGSGAVHLDSNGRPSAPALLDMDYPPLGSMPLGAGLGAAAGAGRPQQPPLSASGRHMSAPRLEDAGWWSDAPPAPISRPASETMAAGVVASAPAGLGSGAEGDSALCVFCMDAPATAGLLHGESVHKCLCRECATHLKESNVQHCPMCREPIQAFIMRVF